MTHAARSLPVLPPHALGVMTCRTCGKPSFRNRRAARRYARTQHPGAVLRAYQCGDYWHVRPTPPEAKHGEEPEYLWKDSAS